MPSRLSRIRFALECALDYSNHIASEDFEAIKEAYELHAPAAQAAQLRAMALLDARADALDEKCGMGNGTASDFAERAEIQSTLAAMRAL